MKFSVLIGLVALSIVSIAKADSLVCMGKAEFPFAFWMSSPKDLGDFKEVNYKIFYQYDDTAEVPSVFKVSEWKLRNSSSMMYSEKIDKSNGKMIELDGGRSGSLVFNLKKSKQSYTGTVSGDKLDLIDKNTPVKCHMTNEVDEDNF